MLSRSECEDQVKGYNKAKYKKFSSLRQAEDFIAEANLAPQTGFSTSTVEGQSTAGPSTSAAPVVKFLPPISNTIATQEGWDVVYCDGACKGNQMGKRIAVAGVGVWWGKGDPRYICPCLFYRLL